MKLFLVGGFLGSGKTTAIREACLQLLQKKNKVAVITNDQGSQLVDTGFIKISDVPGLEVTNGCFCCNYDKLEKSIKHLQEYDQPEVIFAESVGSCTDLVATVIKPFQQVHTDVDILVTVFADAGLLPAMIQGSRLFADSVNYIYKKQLDEADVLVINKIDLLEGKQLEALKQMVEKNYSGKIILYQNSLKSEDIEHWLSVLRGFQTNARESLTLDYELYGAGEAELAWLDAEVEISAIENNAFDSGAELIKSIYSRISEDQLPIGHLKFLISDGEHHRKISFTSINKPDFTWKGPVFAGKVKLIINARVQTRPDHLREIVSDSIREVEMKTSSKVFEKEMSSFTPGYPRPTHRILD